MGPLQSEPFVSTPGATASLSCTSALPGNLVDYCYDGVPVCYLNTCVCQRHQGPAAQNEDLQLQG
ncbi:UNVERIFIED_CONTAM: hypothetical protein Sangu_0132200 [Sesamum angustifolium]|uniref:Uncharacterized protein n=1 Tax=Sesamum angustifolium TaxID=2727405 RepID=A0AAW2RKU9_9LAMI